MLFNSIVFIVFFIVVLGFYYSPLGWTNKKRMLLLASYVFYGLWNPPLILLLWISTVVDWQVGNRLHKLSDAKKRKLWLLLSLVVNLGFLGFFKYGGFLLENFTLFLFNKYSFLIFFNSFLFLQIGFSTKKCFLYLKHFNICKK